MIRNIGTTDKIVRWVVGLVILGAGIYYGSWWGIFGFVLIVTALISFCPLYVPLKISTLKKEEPKN